MIAGEIAVGSSPPERKSPQQELVPTLIQNERLQRIRKLRCLHRIPLIPAKGRSQFGASFTPFELSP